MKYKHTSSQLSVMIAHLLNVYILTWAWQTPWQPHRLFVVRGFSRLWSRFHPGALGVLEVPSMHSCLVLWCHGAAWVQYQWAYPLWQSNSPSHRTEVHKRKDHPHCPGCWNRQNRFKPLNCRIFQNNKKNRVHQNENQYLDGISLFA